MGIFIAIARCERRVPSENDNALRIMGGGGEFPSRAGSKRLKISLFQSAWVASCHNPLSKAYYDRKRAEETRQMLR